MVRPQSTAGKALDLGARALVMVVPVAFAVHLDDDRNVLFGHDNDVNESTLAPGLLAQN
jgi:hypothetical protein